MEAKAMVTLTIDGKEMTVPDGITVLEAAREAGIRIPTLCHHPDLTPYGGCRLCWWKWMKRRDWPRAASLRCAAA